MILDTKFELINVGYFDSRLSKFDYSNYKITPQRKIQRYEIELYLSAGGNTYIDGKQYTMEKNSLFILKPGQTRCSETPFSCYFLYLELPEGGLKDILDQASSKIIIYNYKSYQNKFFSLIKHTDPATANEHSALRLVSHICELVYNISADQEMFKKQRDFNLNTNLKPIVEAKRFIAENYMNDIELKDIANFVYLSPIYFHKLFSKIVGITPHEYLINERLSQAKKMLLSTDMPIVSIATKCGFNSQSYFNYIFKKEMGMTPKQYKQRMGTPYDI